MEGRQQNPQKTTARVFPNLSGQNWYVSGKLIVPNSCEPRNHDNYAKIAPTELQILRTVVYLLTLVGVVSSDVSRSSCTTSLTPCCSIFSHSYVFLQGCRCQLLDVIDELHPFAGHVVRGESNVKG